MKLHRFGAFSAMIAATAFVACSSDQAGEGQVEGDSSIAFNLTTAEGVVITSVNYDLNTQVGADVSSGSIPVPESDSVISLGIESVAAGDYSLAFAATGVYEGASVPCISSPVLFSLLADQDLTLPTITMICTISTGTVDDTGSVNANVEVVVDQISVGANVETFSYGPRSVVGRQNTAGDCVFPPIALNVSNVDTTITYGWSALPDGTFDLNALNTAGTYTCASGGDKTLTVSATKDGVTSSKSITVGCDASACTVTGPVCGNGEVETGEECDESTPRCTLCEITPVCGDGITDAPEECDDAGASATCDINCQDIPVVTEECGNGILEGTEECDPGPVPTATCDVDCNIIIPDDTVCEDCISANTDLGPVQETYCDPVAGCLAVQECVFDSGCYLPIPARCYCGDDVDACENPDFTPVGPCVDSIRAGTNTSTNAENAVTLERFYDFNYPTGVALSIVDEASRVCNTECF